ncbi:class I SAM-dependent methyltransferase [Cognatishimia sp. MH4019]|uniref:class I SAM-dependent methyltransferase n=1 Tax=Cognatishimia sp. MH4019 TaxID=2854030 RepID=UPI001CD20CE9|nr:class I SAM-dependent methyltransferase [Cognatishimia sp. MH4019]
MHLTAQNFFSQTAPVPDPATESAFISGLKMRNGTFKQTSPSRFASLEDPLAQALAPTVQTVDEVLDIGISIGHTTVELADFLKRIGGKARITGTDLFIDAHLIELGDKLQVLTDARGWPLQYSLFGRPFRPWSSRLDYVTLAAVPRALAHKALRPTLERKIARAETRRVQLVGQSLQEHGIASVENDVFTRTPAFEGRFDFIRAANILNNGYFAPEQLRRAIGNIKAYSTGVGSHLLVVRTIGDHNNGTLFQLNNAMRYDVVTRFGQGSEIEALVLGHCDATPEQ